jgi:hypothetical protein
MKESANTKIHISSNFQLSICLLIMLDTLLLAPSLQCNTSLHFTTLHPTTLHYTYRHFTSPHLHFTTCSFGLNHLHFLPLYFHLTPLKLDTVHFSRLQTYFQNNEHLLCPKGNPHNFNFNLHHFLFIFYFFPLIH